MDITFRLNVLASWGTWNVKILNLLIIRAISIAYQFSTILSGARANPNYDPALGPVMQFYPLLTCILIWLWNFLSASSTSRFDKSISLHNDFKIFFVFSVPLPRNSPRTCRLIPFRRVVKWIAITQFTGRNRNLTQFDFLEGRNCEIAKNCETGEKTIFLTISQFWKIFEKI